MYKVTTSLQRKYKRWIILNRSINTSGLTDPNINDVKITLDLNISYNTIVKQIIIIK